MKTYNTKLKQWLVTSSVVAALLAGCDGERMMPKSLFQAIASQTATITASDGAEIDGFGSSVAISGDIAVVGAIYDDAHGMYSGSAYVYVRSGTMWAEEQKLSPADGEDHVYFGSSVGISGDTVIVGAYGAREQGWNSGAAYLFVRTGTSWGEQQKLVPVDVAEDDAFGASVAISGDTAIVGALGDDDLGESSGSAYVYVRSGTNWTMQQKLTALDGSDHDYLGGTVAISDDTVIVGAYETSDNGPSSGSAYVFVRSGTSWTEQEKLLASDGAADDYFGASVAISGDTAVVGAFYDDDRGVNSGSAYLFVRSGTSWTEQEKLMASDGAANDFFGLSVALSGNTAIVGALYDDDRGVNSGSAYLFVRSGTSWTEQEKLLASDGAANDNFASAVAISENVAVVGATGDDDRAMDAGAIYLFNLSSATSPTLTAPASGTTLTGSSATFTWHANGTAVTEWWLYVGTVTGMSNIYDSGSLGTSLSNVVNNLPTDGKNVYVRLWYKEAGSWKWADTSVKAFGASELPSMVSPSAGATLPGANVTFEWADSGWGSQMWWLYVGSTQGGSNYYNSGWINNATTTSKTALGLPTNGSMVWVRLWYKRSDTAWLYQDIQYVTAPL